MKKLTLLLSPLVLANMAFAGGQNTPSYGHGSHAASAPRLFNGFMAVGALGGLAGELTANQTYLSSADTTLTAVSGYSTFSASITESDHYELFENSMAGYLELDYAYQFHNGFWLGVGALAGFDNLKFKNTNRLSAEVFDGLSTNFSQHDSTLEVELKNDFAVLFKPGFVVRHNTLIYALVGPRWGNIKTSLNTADGVESGILGCPGCAVSFNLNERDSSSEYQIGITAGAGIKQMVSERVSIGLEYAYTHYSDLDAVATAYARKESALFEGILVTQQFSGLDTYDDMSLTTQGVVATLSYRL